MNGATAAAPRFAKAILHLLFEAHLDWADLTKALFEVLRCWFEPGGRSPARYMTNIPIQVVFKKPSAKQPETKLKHPQNQVLTIPDFSISV
jgi:hypothetical protein